MRLAAEAVVGSTVPMTRLLRTWRLEFEKEAVTGIAKPDRSAAEDREQLRRENPGRRQARGV